MVYYNRFAVAIKSNGSVLREVDDTVYLPFNSNYSILLKNLHSRKAKVKVWIDGEDILDGNELIIHPNNSLDLKRFLLNGNLNTGPRFKFIEKTNEIESARGNRVDDGIVRVEYQFEAKKSEIKLKKVEHHHHHHHHDWYPYYPWPYYPTIYCSNNAYVSDNDNSDITTSGTNITNGLNGQYTFTNSCGDSISDPRKKTRCTDKTLLDNVACAAAPFAQPQNDDGITVKGEEVNQGFHYASIGELEDGKHVICLKLRGKTKKSAVSKPITVKTKVTCSVCNKTNKPTHKFCSKCGNNLNW